MDGCHYRDNWSDNGMLEDKGGKPPTQGEGEAEASPFLFPFLLNTAN